MHEETADLPYPDARSIGDEHAFERRQYLGATEDLEDVLEEGPDGYHDEEIGRYEELFTKIAAGHYLLTSTGIFLIGATSAIDGASDGDYGKLAMGGFLTATGAKFLHAGLPHASDLYDSIRDRL